MSNKVHDAFVEALDRALDRADTSIEKGDALLRVADGQGVTDAARLIDAAQATYLRSIAISLMVIAQKIPFGAE